MSCPDCGTATTESAESCPDCGRSLAVPVGTVLADRYQIQALLGVGGLGRVYRAHDRMLDELVAIKVLHIEASRSAELGRRFRSEIKLARKVRHRNVCAIHEYGEQGAYRFVAMELVDGVDLHRVIHDKGPLPPREAFEVAIQVTKGLNAIHDAGVLHRDLKTPNIMQDRRGVVRLLDFGIARLLTPPGTGSVTAVHRVVGTPEYMSPEQIRGDDLDERSDIYAFGVVVFEIFTGVVPFQGKSPLDTLLRQVNDPPPLYGAAASRIPASLVPVLRRALAKDPRDRPGSARELTEELRASRRDALPEAPQTPPSSRTATRLPKPPLPPAKAAGPVAPPIPPARIAAPATTVPAAGDEKHTLVDLPVPPPSRSAGEPPPRKASRGWALGALGLLGVALVFFLVRRPEPATVPPPTLSQADVVTVPSPAASPATPPSAAASEPSTAPSPDLPPATTAVASEPEASPAASPRRERPSPTPSPSPTATPTPTPTPAPTGGLDVDVRPAADVEIEGRGTGKAPLEDLPLDPGVHVVTLSHADYWPLVRKVSIEAGKTARLDVDLSWEGVLRARSRVPPYAVPIDGGPHDDPYFLRALRQLAGGDFQEAVLTLEPVARRLQAQGGKAKEQARAEFYLGCAYLELNRQALAKERFQAALEHDGSLKPPAGAFSPKIASFFATVRETVRKKP